MKKLTLSMIYVIGAYSSVFAQGWIGNSSTNTLYSVNSGLGLAPLSVGIGVNAPTEQLHTTAGVRFQGLPQSLNYPRIVVADNNGVLSWANASGGAFWSLTGNGGTVPGTVPGQNYLGTSDLRRLVIATNAAERMTVLTNGNVGIATNAPTNRLEVINSGSEGRDQQVGIGGKSVSIRMFDGLTCPIPAPAALGAPYAKIGLASLRSDFVQSSDPGDLIIQTISDSRASIIFSNSFSVGAGNGNEQMRLTGNGFLGIGTSAPTSVVEVVIPGTGGLRGILSDGSTGPVGWIVTSDKRVKTNVQPIKGAMDIVSKLNGVYYNLKTANPTARQVGFLAQDVRKVLPEVVSGKEGDISKGELLGMAYQNIVPVLVEALKEKDIQIAQLINRMDKLEQKLASSDKGPGDPSDEMDLKQNVPNPFVSMTTVEYAINRAGNVQIDLFDPKGILIRNLENGEKPAGKYQLGINGSDLQSGTYVYTLKLNGKQLSRKAIKL